MNNNLSLSFRFKGLILLITISIFSSCSVRDEMYIHDDGSGEYSFSIDILESIKVTTGAIQYGFLTAFEEDLDSLELQQKVLASLTKMENKYWEESKLRDTIISFESFAKNIPDSIKQTKEYIENYEMLKNMAIIFDNDREKNKSGMGFQFSFPNVNEINDPLKFISNNRKIAGVPENKVAEKNELVFQYSFKGNKFKRKIAMNDPKDETQDKINADGQTVSNNFNNQELGFLFNDLKYLSVIHFDSKIKSINCSYPYNVSGNTVTFEYPIVLANSIQPEFEVTLE